MNTLTEQVREGAEQAWASLSEGWRELRARASGALTRGELRIEIPRLERGHGRRITVKGP